MPQKTLTTERMEITFGETPLSILKIRNRTTGAIMCAGGEQSFLVRMPLSLSEPQFLTEVTSVTFETEGGSAGVRFRIQDETGSFYADVHLTSFGDGIMCTMEAHAPSPIWLVEWQLTELAFEEVIVPALGGQVINSAMPKGKTLSYKFPFWWNAQFVIGRKGEGGLWLHTKDEHPYFKLLRVKKQEEGFALSLGFEADGPLRSTGVSATWYLESFEGSWKNPVDSHRTWLEKTYPLKPIAQNKHFPEWASKINFILEMWGMRKDRPAPHHTFEQMMLRLKEWTKLHPPDETLVYLPGFAEHGIDSNAPSYSPSRNLGGSEKFSELMHQAHDLGYRVMAHTNVVAMTFTHPEYTKFRKYQVLDVFGKAQGWGLDMDGDWLAEPYFAYINPGVKAWSQLMEYILGELIRNYALDAIFLDQTLLAFNVSRGPNFIKGMRSHIERLQKAFPNTLLAGEGMNEFILPALPVAQIHGLDSIAEVHGMDGTQQWRSVHPVSMYLFGKYTRFTGHLLTRHPSETAFELQETAYSQLNVIPVLALYDDRQPLDGTAVRKMIARANASRDSLPAGLKTELKEANHK